MSKKTIRCNAEQLANVDIESLQKKINYRFKDERLLRTAVTHASSLTYMDVHKNKKSTEHYCYYEQLEFVGDRVLGLVIAHMLYDMFPAESEGDWAKRHTEAVREETLAKVAEQLGLGEYLLLSSGEHHSGGRRKKALLSDAMEAVIAAVYLDANFEAAKALIENLWECVLRRDVHPPEDPKTRLQEWLQARGIKLPEYKLISCSGPDHAPIFEVAVLVEGMEPLTVKAPSKRSAEKKAAELLLQNIEQRGNKL